MKKTETNIWATSDNGCWFYVCDEASSREEAIKECLERGDTHIGRAVMVEFTEDNVGGRVDEILEDLAEVLYDEVGDVADNWELDNEQMDELEKRIAKTVIDYLNEEGLQPSQFKVADIEEVKGGD